MSLPSSRCFITQLLDSLPATPDNLEAGANPLSAVPETAKKQLLSLQVLFPNEFLPALDLLDRGLVTRLRISNSDSEEDGDADETTERVENVHDEPVHTDNAMLDATDNPDNEQLMTDTLQDSAPTAFKMGMNTIYYVRSAQARSSRFATSYESITSYEVRLRAWNCSCPAFAFAAFPVVHPEPATPVRDVHADSTMQGAWMFGGVTLGDGIPPVCKHLLACVLVEKCSGLFGGFVEERRVSVEEAAGWAAGWGD